MECEIKVRDTHHWREECRTHRVMFPGGFGGVCPVAKLRAAEERLAEAVEALKGLLEFDGCWPQQQPGCNLESHLRAHAALARVLAR